MKIGILQFNPLLGEPERNIAKADSLLAAYKNVSLDLLVLPEMAFSGYNFQGVEDIEPFLEPSTAGRTTQWAKQTAMTRSCVVVVGYPERSSHDGEDVLFNSTVTVGPNGAILANYRKSFLYYTDETWAKEGFKYTETQEPFFTGTLGHLGLVGHGICMDINPYQFTADFADYEFATVMLQKKVRLVVLSMAWITRLSAQEVLEQPERPDMETVAYWLTRFWPFVNEQPEEPIVIVMANRCGSEGSSLGMAEMDHGVAIDKGNEVAYAGSSCVMRFQSGSVKLWEHYIGPRKGDVGLMGKREEGLMVVDTSVPAGFLLQQKTG